MSVCEVLNKLLMRLFGNVSTIGPCLVQHCRTFYTGTGYFSYCTFAMIQFVVQLQMIISY